MNGCSGPDIHGWQHIKQMYQTDNAVDRMEGQVAVANKWLLWTRHPQKAIDVPVSHLNVVLMFDMDFLTKLYIYQSFLIAMNTQERGSCSISWDNYFTSGSG